MTDSITEKSSGVILAGGESRRFGSDKALADWRGAPMIASVVKSVGSVLSKTLVVVKKPELYRFLEGPRVEVVKDLLEQQHPLGGIYTALSVCSSERVFVCACDMPLLRPGLIRALFEAVSGYEAAIPLWGGESQPLCGVYSRGCFGVVRRMISEARFPIRELFKIVPTRFLLEEEVRIHDPEGVSFQDVDTREDYEKLKRSGGRRARRPKGLSRA